MIPASGPAQSQVASFAQLGEAPLDRSRIAGAAVDWSPPRMIFTPQVAGVAQGSVRVESAASPSYAVPKQHDKEIQDKDSEPSGRKKRKYEHESFPEKLHRLIIEASISRKDHIVRYTADGARFQILHTKSFEDEILPRYFRHNRISSFKRLLRMYGFKRIDGTWMQGTFEHPLFNRDNIGLCKHMERVGRKTQTGEAKTAEEKEE